MKSPADPIASTANGKHGEKEKSPSAKTKRQKTAAIEEKNIGDDTPAVWDEAVGQQFHGGQDWQFLQNFHEDFSVTTNGLGTPKRALEAARQALNTIDHYPPANQEPALTSLAGFLWPDMKNAAGELELDQEKRRLLLGNGASELIDLVVRVAPPGAWKPGPTTVQYKEYQRSAESHGRRILTLDDNDEAAGLYCLVNPTNPTGDYMPVEELKQWIETSVPDGAAVTVDESMQLWVGPQWRQDSLISQRDWLQALYNERRIAVYVIHSWTKIWSCTGIRLGSIVCPTTAHADSLRRLQVPWSVNTPALAFLNQVVTDDAYLTETWRVTPVWHQYALSALRQLSSENPRLAKMKCHGKSFLSWIWLDMNSKAVAERAVQLAKAAGVPVRWAKPGYDMPTHVRIAVRKPEQTDILIAAWRDL